MWVRDASLVDVKNASEPVFLPTNSGVSGYGLTPTVPRVLDSDATPTQSARQTMHHPVRGSFRDPSLATLVAASICSCTRWHVKGKPGNSAASSTTSVSRRSAAPAGGIVDP